MAPIVRRTLTSDEVTALEHTLASQESTENILTELKSGRPKRKRPGYEKKSKKDEDCELLVNIELQTALKNVIE